MSFQILLFSLLFGGIPVMIAWCKPKAWFFGVLLSTAITLIWIAIDVMRPIHAASMYFLALGIGTVVAYRIKTVALLRDKHKMTLERLQTFQKMDGDEHVIELSDDAYTDKEVP